MAKKRPPLVSQYFENVSRAAIKKFQPIIRQYIRGRTGIYALYRGSKLFYVGLASNLNSRLKHHLKKSGWDRFSVYLTIGDGHMKELESLTLRIMKPKGNKVSGRLKRSDNLRKQFTRDIKQSQRDELDFMLGRNGVIKLRRQKRRNNSRRMSLARQFKTRMLLIGYYKGETYKAILRKNGTIRFRNRIFTTPSAAAKAATKRATYDGWWFWHYERAPGDWVRLKELRR